MAFSTLPRAFFTLSSGFRNILAGIRTLQLLLLTGLAFAFGSAGAIELEITSNVNPIEDGFPLTITMTVSNPDSVLRTNVVLQATTPALYVVRGFRTSGVPI